MTAQRTKIGRNIGLIDDVFRCEINGVEPFPINILWLDGVLKPVLRHLGGTVTRVASHRYGERRVDIGPVLQHFGLTGGQSSWARLLDTDADKALERWLEPYLDGLDMLVGFELPNPVFQCACALGLPVLDFGLSPIRFMEDLCFEVRCSAPWIADMLRPAAIAEDEVLREVCQIQGTVSRRGTHKAVLELGRTGLLLGQSRIDASLVENGELRTIRDFEDRIVDWAKGHDTIILKPHPNSPQSLSLDRLRRSGVRLLTTNASPYQLFVARNVASAAAISSGSLVEAKWFGLDTLRFVTSPRMRLRPNAVDPVSSGFLTLPFWRALFSGDPLPDRLPRLPSIRRQLNAYWGYDPSFPDVVLRPLSLRDRIAAAMGRRH